jgi:excinuclease UvrABC helicase subunit UvrB
LEPGNDFKELLVAEELAAYGADGDGDGKSREKDLDTLQKLMKEASDNLEFEKAALLRDRIRKLQSADSGS